MRRYTGSRRQLLRGAGACLLTVALPRAVGAVGALPAIPELDGWLAGRVPRIERVTLDLPRFADNADAVPMTLKVTGPFSGGKSVLRIRLFSEKNPYPRMAEFHLMPGLARVELETRVRLAESQTVVAIAELEHGELLAGTAEVTVTASACIDGG